MLSLVQYLWFILSDKNQKRPKCFRPENYHCLSPTNQQPPSCHSPHHTGKSLCCDLYEEKVSQIQWFTFFYGSFLFFALQIFLFLRHDLLPTICNVSFETIQKMSSFLLLLFFTGKSHRIKQQTESKSNKKYKKRFMFNGKWGFCKMLIKYKNFARHLLYRFKKWCQVLGGGSDDVRESETKIVALDLLYFDKLFNWIENVLQDMEGYFV